MGITKTLGGERLGSGKKMKVEMHGFERSTFNMSYLWRSTMSAGTLVPFLTEIGLPGDTFDIDLDVDLKTHPTSGPLFGSYKIQLDTFVCPIRLYQGALHNNKLGIGLRMADIKLPIMELFTNKGQEPQNIDDWDNHSINPSCILSYIGIRGIGNTASEAGDTLPIGREFMAIGLLSYWDICKQYFFNKMEDNAYVIHATPVTIVTTVTVFEIEHGVINYTITNTTANTLQGFVKVGDIVTITYVGLIPVLNQIMLNVGNNVWVSMEDVLANIVFGAGTITGNWAYSAAGASTIPVGGWDYINANILPLTPPTLVPFPITNIDDMREKILEQVTVTTPFRLNDWPMSPYDLLLDQYALDQTAYKYPQEGLAVKTYQSDLFNNWLNTEWIDGTNGINEISSIDTSGGSITIDTINLAEKVYAMLNRIAISGGTYDDWLDAVYAHDRYTRAESPIYMGGLIRELVFQEVVSNSQQSVDGGADQPLGTLAGKGVMAHKKKGGSVTIRIDEPSYIMGIISLTPRIDYSQGNKWDIHLKTMDDFHKPSLDQIGFQDLITEQMAWFDTIWDYGTGEWTQFSAGKQPAWMNYMTNVNQTRGNFAIRNNEMFMTLNRRYEHIATQGTQQSGRISDLTTYIDPVKFNYSFAQTSLDAQNFWAQISVDMKARRKMSSKIIPNL